MSIKIIIMPIKAIIFDLGSVYVHHKQKFWSILAKRLNVSVDSLEKEVQKYLSLLDTGKIQDAEFWKKIGEGLKVNIPEESETWIWERAEVDHPINKDVETLVKKLKNYGYKIASISNTEKTTVDYAKRNGWFKYFDVAINSFDVGVMKPDPQIYEIALEEIKEKPGDCIFVDDIEIFLKAAERIGMKTILFDNSKQNAIYLKKELIKLGVNEKALIN